MKVDFSLMFQPPHLFWTILTAAFIVIIAILILAGDKLFLKKASVEKKQLFDCLLFLVLIAYFVRFFYFDYPYSTFWDENYHVASAEKYIDHVFFLEPHPPLGKMVIAFGEWIFNPNAGIDKASFNTTDYITNFPAGFSFFGVRFFPTLLSFLSVIIFFFILYSISKKPLQSLLFTSFYLLENGQVMHTRSAMLEGTQIFFILLAVLYFVRLFQSEAAVKVRQYLILGLLIGLSVAVKLNSLIIVLLFLFLIIKEYWTEIQKIDLKLIFKNSFKKHKIKWKNPLTTAIFKLAAGAVGAVLTLLIIFYAHFSICTKVLNDRTYEVSTEAKILLNVGASGDLWNFPAMMGEYVKYMNRYEKGVPVWDPTKIGENGSPAILWPFGYKAINYRWAKFSQSVQYFYFMGNPVVWYGGLLAVILGLAVLMSRWVLGFPVKNKKLFNLIGVFTALYGGYMAAVIQIDRVMYLYHYLVPLVFASILFYLIYLYVFEKSLEENNKLLLTATILLAAEVAVVFLFFSPFTYGFPLETTEFVRRAWLKLWNLQYINF